jgi:hypothetical protein
MKEDLNMDGPRKDGIPLETQQNDSDGSNGRGRNLEGCSIDPADVRSVPAGKVRKGRRRSADHGVTSIDVIDVLAVAWSAVPVVDWPPWCAWESS